MMAYSPGYPTDINSKPDRKERSWKKQKSLVNMVVETKKQAIRCALDSPSVIFW